MNLFDDLIGAVREKILAAESRVFDLGDGGEPWPASTRPELVMEKDTGLELGHPAEGSFALLLWTADPTLVRPDRLTLVGPDLHESETKRLPFVKIVLLKVDGFDESNCHARHRDLSLLHHQLLLDGYMVRAAALYQQEWSRIDRHALGRGYGVAGMGRALSRLYAERPFVDGVELMIGTAFSPGPQQFEPLGRRAGSRIAAMNRMHEELAFDCSDCDYVDVCRDVSALRAMRTTLKSKQGQRGEVNDAG
jgi:CO dehydrogenase/acetyl-CoA synthase beta subunit